MHCELCSKHAKTLPSNKLLKYSVHAFDAHCAHQPTIARPVAQSSTGVFWLLFFDVALRRLDQLVLGILFYLIGLCRIVVVSVVVSLVYVRKVFWHRTWTFLSCARWQSRRHPLASLSISIYLSQSLAECVNIYAAIYRAI